MSFAKVNPVTEQTDLVIDLTDAIFLDVKQNGFLNKMC